MSAQIIVQAPTGSVALDVPRECVVDQILSLLHDRTGIPANQFNLVHNCKQLRPQERVQLSSADHLHALMPLVGGAKKKPKGTRNAGVNLQKRELVFKEDGQEYARCTALKGNRRIDLDCLDGTKRIGIIRGSMKRGAVNRIRPGDVVLVGLRDFQDEKCDVIHKYDSEEVHRLSSYGEIDQAKLGTMEEGGAAEFGDLDDDIEFHYSDGDIDDI